MDKNNNNNNNNNNKIVGTTHVVCPIANLCTLLKASGPKRLPVQVVNL